MRVVWCLLLVSLPAFADTVDGGLVVAMPTALPTGISTGVGGGWMRGIFGARVEGLTTTESSSTWTVTDRELRLRATAAFATHAGRGTFALRLGLGGTLVSEIRERNQGKRAGLMGDELEQSALALLPAADLALAIDLPIMARWSFALSGGPSIALDGGDIRCGWSAQLGVGWQP